MGRLTASLGVEGAADADLLFREALAAARQLGMRPLEAHCHAHLADLYVEMGRANAAAQEQAASHGLFASLGMTASARSAVP
jgi:hypothetical protein